MYRLIASLLLVISMQTHAEPQLQIEREVLGDQHLLRGVLANDRAGRFLYRLSLTKQGRSGQANSTQAGSVELKANQPLHTSRLLINVQPGDHYSVHLELLNPANQPVAERWLQHP